MQMRGWLRADNVSGTQKSEGVWTVATDYQMTSSKSVYSKMRVPVCENSGQSLFRTVPHRCILSDRRITPS